MSTQADVFEINVITRRVFDSLAIVTVTGFADMCYFKKRQINLAVQRLRMVGIMESADDYDSALAKYNQWLESYAQSHLPDDYHPSRDYWGARCFKRDCDSSQDKQLPFFGDAEGHYKMFDSFAAMEQYTQNLLVSLGS